jgi:hypothetical protein
MMKWIPVTDSMPKASDEMTHDDDVLVYLPPRDIPSAFKDREPIHFSGGIYLGHPKVTPDPADEKGERNFWGTPTEESDWTIWGYSYFMGAPKPTHWMPLPEKPNLDQCDWSQS